MDGVQCVLLEGMWYFKLGGVIDLELSDSIFVNQTSCK